MQIAMHSSNHRNAPEPFWINSQKNIELEPVRMKKVIVVCLRPFQDFPGFFEVQARLHSPWGYGQSLFFRRCFKRFFVDSGFTGIYPELFIKKGEPCSTH